MATENVRVDGEVGFVLHGYPYKETSLLVEAFTSAHGRVALVAKGAKRPRSELRGLLQAFHPLTLSWSGRGEVKSLVAADWRGGLPMPQGAALMCAFYLNELLLKLMPRDDPHPALYAEYERALAGLACDEDQPTVLRRFELRLLAELGYGLELEREADTGRAIVAEARYHYVIERGPVLVRGPVAGPAAPGFGGAARSTLPGARGTGAAAADGAMAGPTSGIARSTLSPMVLGATLLALSAGSFPDARLAAEAKQLMREVLDHHLEQRSLFSRRLIRDLQALESYSPEEQQ